MSQSYPADEVTTATRHQERVGYDREAVHAVLDEAVVAHVGFVVDGRPVVLPQLYVRVGEILYLHGSTGARALRLAQDGGLEVCVTVTLVDGLVLARSAFHHSINYRSVVVHGRATVITDAVEKQTVLRSLVDAVVPGRSEHVRGPSRRELAATTVLAVALEQASLKMRTGPPNDDEDDLGLPFWSGVLPISGSVPGPPESAPDLRPGIAVPDHVRKWRRSLERQRP